MASDLASLQNKRLILGVTGGIAAYKSPDLVRRLRDTGADVKVVMTRAASEFITPLTLQAVSGNRVHTELLDADAEAAMGHIELARWADAIVIAPATADILARLAGGRADDLLTTLIRASDAPLLLAPAMNQAMWRDQTTQDNVRKAIELGYQLVGPAAGAQACGDTGVGRMAEPADIAAAAAAMFENTAWSGRRLVITAGPTQEAIDPVRYLSNHSSGKMGFAIAEAAAAAGARVTLIAGPVALSTPPRVERVDVVTAAEMLAASEQHSASADVFIAAAAVADYRLAEPAQRKIKKRNDAPSMTLELIENPDILAIIAAKTNSKRPQFAIGFAAETHDLLDHAEDKMRRKNLDMIIANDVSRSDIGFAADQNEVTVLVGDEAFTLPLASKSKLARQLLEQIAARLLAS